VRGSRNVASSLVLLPRADRELEPTERLPGYDRTCDVAINIQPFKLLLCHLNMGWRPGVKSTSERVVCVVSNRDRFLEITRSTATTGPKISS